MSLVNGANEVKHSKSTARATSRRVIRFLIIGINSTGNGSGACVRAGARRASGHAAQSFPLSFNAEATPPRNLLLALTIFLGNGIYTRGMSPASISDSFSPVIVGCHRSRTKTRADRADKLIRKHSIIKLAH